MNRVEIFDKVPDLTDSVFRRLKRSGVITTVKKGSGKGRGKGSDQATYADNSVDVIQVVMELGDTVRRNDLIYALLWRGYEIDFQKLHGRLYEDFDRLKVYLKSTGELSDDTEALHDAAKNQLEPLRPGKPSNEELRRRKQQVSQKAVDIKNNLVLADQISKGNPIGRKLLSISGKEEAYDQEGIDFLDQWLRLERLKTLVDNATVDDLGEVHRSILIIRKYMSVLRENLSLLDEVLDLFFNPMLLKLALVQMLW